MLYQHQTFRLVSVLSYNMVPYIDLYIYRGVDHKYHCDCTHTHTDRLLW